MTPARRALLEEEARALGQLGALSGGWAWHFLAPPHEDSELLHDHHDIDLLVDPENVVPAIAALAARGFVRVGTRFVRSSSLHEFRRYERHAIAGGARVKIPVDFFVARVPSRRVKGVSVVEPAVLLGFYPLQKKACWSVRQARLLWSRGLDVENRPELVTMEGE